MRQLSSLPEGVSRYELIVVPTLWLTTRRRDHRIFQDQNSIQITTSVLGGYGQRIAAPASQCGSHAPREYCVQYGETDFDFVSRVLADEGVSFFFAQPPRASLSGAHTAPSTLSLMDDTRTAPAIDHPIRFIPPGGALRAGEACVSSVLVSSGLETSITTLRDYDFERPAFNFESKARMSGELFDNESELESYTYEVGQFSKSDDQERAAQILQEARSHRDVYLLGASFAIAPGTRLTLAGHAADHVNREHLVVASRSRVSVNEDGDAIGHHSHETIPATARYRSPRRPKPRIHGTQTAFVVGRQENVDEIDVDNYGRVKVRFTWDRRATSVAGKPTRFIRVSQGWAGQGYGLVLLPRVGDELVIAYQDGDPDEPIAVGRVHNAIYPSPLNLPDTDDTTVSMWKSRSSPMDKESQEDRYNMVRMQDKAGAEMLELRAQRDFHQETLHDSNEEVGHNQSVRVKGAQSTSAGSISMNAGSTFNAHAGTDMSLKADGALSAEAGKTLDASAGTNLSAAAGQKLDASAGSDMSATAGEHMDATAGTDMTLTAGATFKTQAATVLIKGKGIASVHGGDTLFLHGVEVFVTAGATVEVTASAVSINGSGSVTLAGGVVNLNC